MKLVKVKQGQFDERMSKTKLGGIIAGITGIVLAVAAAVGYEPQADPGEAAQQAVQGVAGVILFFQGLLAHFQRSATDES